MHCIEMGLEFLAHMIRMLPLQQYGKPDKLKNHPTANTQRCCIFQQISCYMLRWSYKKIREIIREKDEENWTLNLGSTHEAKGFTVAFEVTELRPLHKFSILRGNNVKKSKQGKKSVLWVGKLLFFNWGCAFMLLWIWICLTYTIKKTARQVKSALGSVVFQGTKSKWYAILKSSAVNPGR